MARKSQPGAGSAPSGSQVGDARTSGGGVATTDQTLEAWLEGPERLVPQVRQWFRDATSRFSPPTEDGCQFFAKHLHAIGPAGYSSEPDPRKIAIKSGEEFLKNIAQQRCAIEQLLRLARFMQVDENSAALVKPKDILFRMNEVQRHFEVLLPYLLPERGRPGEPIRALAQVARELWAETNDRKVPLWKNAHEPLCKLLEPALKAIGHPLARDTISKILRKRRRRR